MKNTESQVDDGRLASCLGALHYRHDAAVKAGDERGAFCATLDIKRLERLIKQAGHSELLEGEGRP